MLKALCLLLLSLLPLSSDAGLPIGSQEPEEPASSSPIQDPPGAPGDAQPDEAPPGVLEEDPAPLLASDGQPVSPGRLPADTSPASRALWDKVLAATRADALPPIQSFNLVFDVRSRRPGAKNQLEVGITYLEDEHPRAPFVRMFLQRRDLVSIHGPDGTWLQDGANVQAMAGREFAEDRAQLREYRTLAGNLLGLVQPKKLRLVSLRALEVLPTEEEAAWSDRRVVFAGAPAMDLPSRKLAEVARLYEWIELRSPDLRVHKASGPSGKEAVYRGRLGIEPSSGEVRLAILHAETPGGAIIPEQAILVDVRSYAELSGGHRLPRHFFVKEINPTSFPLTFYDREGTELGLMVSESSVNPDGVEASSFERPQ